MLLQFAELKNRSTQRTIVSCLQACLFLYTEVLPSDTTLTAAAHIN